MREREPSSVSDPEADGPILRAKLRRLFGLRTVLVLGVLLAVVGLVEGTRHAPRVLLSHIVVLDGQRLALRYLDDIANAFELPGVPVRPDRLTRWKAEVLVGAEQAVVPRFDLFDTVKYSSLATSQAVRGYVVLNRFGDRLFSGGTPRFRSLENAEAAARFKAARSVTSVRAYKARGVQGASDLLISVVVPLAAEEGSEFAGVVMIDIHRNGVEPGILSGIERSIFALVALVLGIASVLLGLLVLLRARGARAQRKANYLSQFDPLTGLHNREAFLSQLAARIDHDHDRKRHFASVLIDIRRFAWINDTFGDAVGDRVLAAFGERLDAMLRRDPEFAQCGANAARLGADEFAAFFSCDTRAQLDRVCRSLARICEADLDAHGVRLHVCAGIGAALFPFDGDTVGELQASVRYALDVAKADGSAGDVPVCVRVFDTEIAAAHRRRRKLLQDIELAISGEQMEVHYQPQVRLDEAGPRLTGFEALLRWRHPDEGFVSPDEFIPLAEQSGTIRDLGAWCLREACREAASWPGSEALTIAVNVSPAQFVAELPGHRGLVGNVAETLAETGLAPDRLELEITEGLPLGEAGDILSGLEALGVGLALDDFGTGYSSLSYLSSIPVGKVKLDRAFVLRMVDDEKVRAIVRAVTTMCDGMGMTVLAEGVETEVEQDLLAELGCRHVQGFLHGRPLKEPQFDPSSGEQVMAA